MKVGSAEALLQALLKELRTTEFQTTAYCHKHRMHCPIIPYDDLELQRVYGQALQRMHWVDVSGTTCVAWSSSGSCEGWCHESCLPALVWAASLRHYGVDAAIHECTARFDHEVLVRVFSEGAVIGGRFATEEATGQAESSLAVVPHLAVTVQPLLFSPVNLGVPSSRTRRYTLFSKLKIVPGFGPNDFEARFFRKLSRTAAVYLRASEEQIRKHVKTIAAQKALVLSSISEDLSPSDVLSGSRWVRMMGYLDMARKKKQNVLRQAAALMVNLEQAPSFNNYLMADIAPALLRHSYLYDIVSEREILPDEHFLVQGLPVPGYVSPELAATFPFPRVMAELCDKQKRQLTGNGMHVHAVGSAIMWLLASIQWSKVVT